MNRVIQFFSYEQCYQHYTKRIMNIRQAKIHGETIVAKPVLMVAIIDGVYMRDYGGLTRHAASLQEETWRTHNCKSRHDVGTRRVALVKILANKI